jgi:hypothetical protein
VPISCDCAGRPDNRGVKLGLLATALALAAGCAAPGPRPRAASAATPAEWVPPARGEFERGATDRVLRSAVTVLREHGHRIATCGETRVATEPRELDVPCGAGNCLGRESVVVRVGYYVARVEVSRVVWNPATRAWDPLLGAAGIEDAALHEQRLLRRILDVVPAIPAPVADACAGGRVADAARPGPAAGAALAAR